MSEEFITVTAAALSSTEARTVTTSGVELVRDRGHHYIEDAVSVYLMRDPNGSTEWVLDPTTVSGETLDSTYERGPENGNCECGQRAECARVAEQMGHSALPNGPELLVMLAAALGYELHPIV